MHTCSHCWHSWYIALLIGLAWWFIASGLLLLTWNHVVARLSKAKPGQFWQALLFTATLWVFCAPRYFMAMRHFGCCHGGFSHAAFYHDMNGMDGADCPYAHGDMKKH